MRQVGILNFSKPRTAIHCPYGTRRFFEIQIAYGFCQQLRVVRGLCQPNGVPIEATTSLPSRKAEVAELVIAPACHVVAPVDELDHQTALRTPLPAFPGGHGQDLFVRVVRAPLAGGVRRLLAMSACLRPAGIAGHCSGRVRGGTEEGGAGRAATVHPVLSAEFPGLLLEQAGKFSVHVLAQSLEIEGLTAARRWEQRLVCGGGAEETDNTVDVIVMAARGTNDWPLDAVHARDTRGIPMNKA